MCTSDDGILPALCDRCASNSHAAIHVPILGSFAKIQYILQFQIVVLRSWLKTRTNKKANNLVFNLSVSILCLFLSKVTPNGVLIPFCSNRYRAGTFLIVLEYQHMVIYRLTVHLPRKMIMAFCITPQLQNKIGACYECLRFVRVRCFARCGH